MRISHLGLILVILLLGILFGQRHVSRVEAVGNLSFTYNDFPVDQPLFTGVNLAPGNCLVRTVTANNASDQNEKIAVKGKRLGQISSLETELTLEISSPENLYKGRLIDIFNSPTEIGLGPIGSNEQKNLDFKLCLPAQTKNEHQLQTITFDLAFGRLVSAPDLPEKCRGLATLISRTLQGTAKNDILRGTTASELIIGGTGNDIIDGGGGNDCLVGGSGNDILRGGKGNDVLIGGIGKNIIVGGQGRDSCSEGLLSSCE